MNRKPIMAAWLIGTLSHSAMADDLVETYQRARQHDAIHASARANREAGVERAAQGAAQLRPTLVLSASSIQTSQDVTIFSSNHYNYRTDAYGLNLTQPLYRKQNWAESNKGEAAAAQAETDFITAQHDLIQRVTRAYLGVLSAEDALAFSETEKNAIERLAQLARRNFSVGNGSLVDVHDTQAALDLAAAQWLVAQNELEVRRESLRAITRVAPGKLASLGNALVLTLPEPANVEGWLETARARNPQIQSAARGVDIADQELERNRGSHHPTLDLVAGHNYSDSSGSVQGFAIESTTNHVGLVFQMPLYAGGLSASRIREAYARREEATQRLEQVRLAVDQQTREAFLAVLSSKARAEALDLALKSNQRALETTLLGYERGVRNGQDVLNNQRALFRARRDYSQARYDYLLAHLRLKGAAGTLAESDVVAVNALLTNR